MVNVLQRQVSTNVFLQEGIITRAEREAQAQHRGAVLWFTGLSGAGKSTLAHAVEDALHQKGCRTYVLDGDNLRHGLCGDLGFSPEDRTENIRRIAEIAKLFVDAGIIVLTAFISPFMKDRDTARSIFLEADFLEIYCDCPLEVCEQRDVKGLYKKARAGSIPEFTGISSPYEAPEHAELTLQTNKFSLNECVEQVLDQLRRQGTLSK